MLRKMLISIFALTALLGGSLVRAQVPAGFELALVSDDGMKTVIGQLPPIRLCAARLARWKARRIRNT